MSRQFCISGYFYLTTRALSLLCPEAESLRTQAAFYLLILNPLLHWLYLSQALYALGHCACCCYCFPFELFISDPLGSLEEPAKVGQIMIPKLTPSRSFRTVACLRQKEIKSGSRLIQDRDIFSYPSGASVNAGSLKVNKSSQVVGTLRGQRQVGL